MPAVPNSASTPEAPTAPRRTATLSPTASAICEATVRFQMSSYRRAWSPGTAPATSSGSRNDSPAGRMASWASWAFFTRLRYTRGWEGRYSPPKRAAIRRPRRRHRRRGQGDGVGAHVGDVPALVEALRRPHGAVRGEAQLAAGFLLQGGGAEGGVGGPAVGLALHGPHRERRLGQVGHHALGGGPVEHHDPAVAGPAGGVEVLAGGHPLASQAHQGGAEAAGVGGAGGEGPLDVPVGGRAEGHPLPLALHHDADGRALHPARRQALAHHLPQHRGDLVAEEAVEDAPGLLGVHQPAVDFARRLQGGPDGAGGDLVEHQAAHRHLGPEDLDQVPGDRLPLPVLVGGQVELVGLLQQPAQLGDLRLRAT